MVISTGIIHLSRLSLVIQLQAVILVRFLKMYLVLLLLKLNVITQMERSLL